MYALRPTASKGLGLFATQHLPAGTRLLTEKPLFTVASESEAYAASRRLGREERRTFLGLTGSDARPTGGLLWLEAGWKTGKELVLDLFTSLLRRNPVAATWPRLPSYLSARSIFLSNNFSLTTSPPRRAVFSQISRLNHACIPNSEANWNERLAAFTIHTLRPVERDEELTLSYLASHGALAADRQKVLKGFCFQCACPACAVATPGAIEGEARRADVQERLREFATNDMAISDLPTSDIAASDVARSSRKTKEIELMRKMLEMYEREGIRGRELATMYIAAAAMAKQSGLRLEAKCLARRGLDLEEVACGRDSQFFAKSMENVEKLHLGDLGRDNDAEEDNVEPRRLAAVAN